MCLLALFSSCDRKVRETVVAEKTTVTESQDDTTPQSALQDRFTAISSLEKPTSLDDQFSYTYGGAAFFTQDEMTAILKQVQEKMLAQANDEQKRLAEKNLEDSKAFLQTNKTADGVVTLDNGVEYKIISPGDGGKPLISDNDIVTMNYSISLIDGSLVESTWHRGHTETVRVSTIQQSTIKEGLEMMRPGGHYLLWIPPELAYGEQGNGVIGPNQVLVVELEIVAVATPTVL